MLIDRLLCEVAERGHVAAARLLLRLGANTRGAGFGPSLDAAIASGRVALVRLLIRNGASLDTEPVRGTPLGSALFYGHLPVVRELFAQGGDPNEPIRADCGIRPLDGAIVWSPHCVSALLRAGADCNVILRERKYQLYWRARREPGDSLSPVCCRPLTLAEATGNRSVIRLLRRFGAKPYRRRTGGKADRGLLVHCVPEPVRRGLALLRRGAGLAAIRGEIRSAEHLRGSGAGACLFSLACRARRTDVVRYFLKLNARAVWFYESLAELTGRSLAIARLLLDAGFRQGRVELFCELENAILAGHLRLVRLLLDRGAPTAVGPSELSESAPELKWPTALMMAVAAGEEACVKLLLERGADPNRGCAAFPAVVEGRLPVAAIADGRYSSLGYEVTQPLAHWGGPLHLAVIAGNLRLFRLLLRKGADPDAIPGLDEYVACLRPSELRQRFVKALEVRRAPGAGATWPGEPSRLRRPDSR
ncbi:MAG: ankyrin repeat domain-containing protein [Opitutaceae bacterium]